MPVREREIERDREREWGVCVCGGGGMSLSLCVCVCVCEFAGVSILPSKICILDKDGAKPEKPRPSLLFSVLHHHFHRWSTFCGLIHYLLLSMNIYTEHLTF